MENRIQSLSASFTCVENKAQAVLSMEKMNHEENDVQDKLHPHSEKYGKPDR